MPCHRLIAIFEDMERQNDPWAEDLVKREERDLHRRASLARFGNMGLPGNMATPLWSESGL
jgi:hypothetical protein